MIALISAVLFTFNASQEPIAGLRFALLFALTFAVCRLTDRHPVPRRARRDGKGRSSPPAVKRPGRGPSRRSLVSERLQLPETRCQLTASAGQVLMSAANTTEVYGRKIKPKVDSTPKKMGP